VFRLLCTTVQLHTCMEQRKSRLYAQASSRPVADTQTMWVVVAVPALLLPIALLTYLRRKDLIRQVLAPRWSRPSLCAHDLAPPLRSLGTTETPPQRRQRIQLPLRAPAEILRDSFGVAHIYAACERDAFFLHGYAQAQDRLWQMEGLRRVGKGRLAEMVGETALHLDRFARTMDWAGLASREWEALQRSEDKGAAGAVLMLQAFAEGVNARIEECQRTGGRGNLMAGGALPMFFMLVGVDPEPWSPVDTLAILRVMAFQMNHGGQMPAIRQLLADVVGNFEAERWSRTSTAPDGSPWPSTVAATPPPPPSATPPPTTGASDAHRPSAAPAAGGGVAAASYSRALLAALACEPSEAELPRRHSGSNWWALAPERSQTGGVLLANDPHLSVKAPNIWYEVHLEAGGGGGDDAPLQITGVCIPGASARACVLDGTGLPRLAVREALDVDASVHHLLTLWLCAVGARGTCLPWRETGFPIPIVGHNAHVAAGVTLGYTGALPLQNRRARG
jgi:acyl-homoserine lactone acylase PvdQ